MKLTKNTIPQAKNYQCDKCKAMAMVLFIKKNVPIAIYKPKENAFSPLTLFFLNFFKTL